MTEDNCGWPTGQGHACRNPATEENGRCWIPSHGDPTAENPHGRPTAITPDDHDDILQAARHGLSKSGCARAAGVDLHSLNRYLDARPDFRRDFARAREKGEVQLIRDGTYGDADPSMTKFLLSTSFGYVKTERKEHLVDSDAELGEDGYTIEFAEHE